MQTLPGEPPTSFSRQTLIFDCAAVMACVTSFAGSCTPGLRGWTALQSVVVVCVAFFAGSYTPGLKGWTALQSEGTFKVGRISLELQNHCQRGINLDAVNYTFRSRTASPRNP